MKFLLTIFLGIIFQGSSTSSFANCQGGELRFTFDNLKVNNAFQLIADFAGLRPQIDPSIVQSGPMNFDCTPWRVAANNIAQQYHLSIRIENGVMYVTRIK